MKKAFAITLACAVLMACHHGKEEQAATDQPLITAEMAYEGVSNYCHNEYDWSIAQDNPEMMNVTMGDETPTEYKVVFRSYTGAFVFFYVDKKTGTTRMVDYVPALDIEEEAGTIQLMDFLK